MLKRLICLLLALRRSGFFGWPYMPKLTRDIDAGELRISLSGATDFQFALDSVRRISGRRFDPDSKLWCFPDDPAIAEKLMLTIKPSADAALVAWVRGSRAEREAALTTPLPEDYKLVLPWADKLYGFQAQAVAYLAANPRMIVADEMGLGKTIQAIAAINEYTLLNDVDAQRPVLVIAPNSAKGVWAREIHKWLGPDEPLQIVDALTPKKREQQLTEGIAQNGFVVVNWEQIRAQKIEKKVQVNHRDGSTSERPEVSWQMRQPIFEQTEWLAIVADEAHRAKNHKSQTARGLWKLQAPIQLALSGTPLQNHPAELWSILRWLYPEQYHEHGKQHGGTAWAYWPFYDEYVEDYETGKHRGRTIIGVKNPDALRFELKGRLIRRTKTEVLDLPEKVREVIPVTLSPKQRKIYDEAENAFWLTIEQAVKEGDQTLAKQVEEVLSGKRKVYEITNGAARTVRMRQVCSTPALLGGEDVSAKLDAAVEIITDAGDKQFVVFTEFVETANILCNRLVAHGLNAKAWTGDVDTVTRTMLEDQFQAGDIDVLVGTIASMGEGVTLTAADTAIFIERHWTPSKNEQAEDRLWRNGQKNQVTILIIEAEDTVDTDRVAPTNAVKEGIVASVIKKDEVKVRDARD